MRPEFHITASGKFRLLVLVAGLTCIVAAVGLPGAWGQSSRSRTSPATRQETETPPLEPGQIDLQQSRVYVYVDKTGLGHEHGIEGKIRSGAIQLGARADAGSIEFDMTSFVVDTDRARKYVGLEGSTSAATRQQVNKNMLGAAVLDVARYPTASFAVVSALHKQTKQGKPVVELKGDFTLHGTTRPLTLRAELVQKGDQWNLRGSFSIQQTDFGITPYTAALGTVGVADRLKIFGDLWIAGDNTTRE